ncbi:MAG: 50S ribosomal protein L15 [Bacteroidetes bacterium]|nr:50S ribosomal protein L15 [Bacteroidota bacterium]
MKIHEIQPAEGATRNRRRIARGQGSGYGNTATRGHKGASSRSGYKRKSGFEGGQMPLHRRLPKFGFKNPFRIEYTVINLERIEEIAQQFKGQEISKAFLLEHKLIKRGNQPLKVLGVGELKTAVTVSADKFSKTAAEAIQKAGGKVITPIQADEAANN